MGMKPVFLKASDVIIVSKIEMEARSSKYVSAESRAKRDDGGMENVSGCKQYLLTLPGILFRWGFLPPWGQEPGGFAAKARDPAHQSHFFCKGQPQHVWLTAPDVSDGSDGSTPSNKIFLRPATVPRGPRFIRPLSRLRKSQEASRSTHEQEFKLNPKLTCYIP